MCDWLSKGSLSDLMLNTMDEESRSELRLHTDDSASTSDE